MKNNIKFSIIIPVYNCEQFIKKCIESILKQTYENYEIIIIDDGSTDNSLQILQQEFTNNNKISIFHKENTGVSDTRNFGLTKTTGNWITFIDADDWIEKDTLKKVIDVIENNPETEVIMTNIYYDNNYNSSVQYEIKDSKIADKEELIDTIICIDYGIKKYGIKYGNCRCIGGKFYKSQLVKENSIEFIKGMPIFEDGIFNLYANQLAKNTYIIKEPLYHYVENSNSVTNTIDKDKCEKNIVILEAINKFYKDCNIENNYSIGYCAIDLLTAIINVVTNEYKNNIKQGSKNLKLRLKDYISYIDFKNIKYKYLVKKNKIVLFLLRKKWYVMLYTIYLMKNKILRK